MTDPGGFYVRRRREILEDGPTVPFEFEELERRARTTLSPELSSFAAMGAGTGDTVRANREGFDRWRIVTRVLREVADPSLEVDLFGSTLAAPVALAPIGHLASFHEEGELAAAQAAASLGVPFSESTVASRTIEDVAAAGGDAPRFFQLYWTADWDVTGSLVSRAEAAGYDAILVTVDFIGPRWTPERMIGANDDRGPPTNVNLETDPVAGRDGADADRSDRFEDTLGWDDLAYLREHTDLPVVVKGILHAEDARLAVEHGLDGIVVSNHGGRQVDGSVGTVTALPRVVDAVDGRLPVFLDGGVRTGADAFKALALGADAVCLGRPYLYGLAVAGERGVYEVLHNVLAELESVVALAGYDDVADVDRSALLDAQE